mgnify:CR=1 FL=1
MNKTLMNIPFSPPDIGEEEIAEVVDTLKSGWITTGPKTKLFESEIAKLCGTNKAVCLNSATAALELILRVLGIGEGDEVIVPAYTYTASASPVCHVGAKLVLIDVDRDTFEMDYSKLESKITDKTKAIIAVDIAGIIADYDKIFEIVEKTKAKFTPKNDIQKLYNRIIVLADGAHSVGAKRNNKMAGNIADFTSFSFHAVKNLTTGEGGAATWKSVPGLDDEKLYKEFQLLSLHGQTKDALHKNGLGNWEYDIVDPLYKCNMTDIMASIGLAQLRRYDELLNIRHNIIKKYNEAFKNLPVKVLNHEDNTYRSSGHLYLVRIDGINETTRNEIIIELAKRGISSNVHYKPLPILTAYKKMEFDINDFPNSYLQYQNEITLPLYSKLTSREVDYIIENFISVLKEFKIC